MTLPSAVFILPDHLTGGSRSPENLLFLQEKYHGLLLYAWCLLFVVCSRVAGVLARCGFPGGKEPPPPVPCPGISVLHVIPAVLRACKPHSLTLRSSVLADFG